jgi:flagellar motor switch protein FliN/FliY
MSEEKSVEGPDVAGNAATPPVPAAREIEKALSVVPVEVEVVLSTKVMPISQVIKLRAGAIIDLDAMRDDPVSLFVNGKPVAHGPLCIIGDMLAVQVSGIGPLKKRGSK